MVDRERFSRIAHHGIAFAAPISKAKIADIEALLELRPGARVLDVGCGRAEWLIAMAERFGVSGIGVDRSRGAIEEARSEASRRLRTGSVDLREEDVAAFEAADGSFDLALCVGSTHALGGHRETLRALRRWVAPGGHVVVGEGFWQQEPAQAYLDGFGGSRDELTTHADNVAAALDEGLIPLYAAVSSPDDWDRYEGHYARNVELWAARHPDDPDTPAMLDRIRRWRDGYLRWGRSTMGFALYLHQVAAAAAPTEQTRD
jgi:cyclopropane fatty-acyl-phospholipid synthase-like methyltransferase